MREQELINQIEWYLKGKTSKIEVDALRMEFITNPDAIELFKSMVNLNSVMKEFVYLKSRHRKV